MCTTAAEQEFTVLEVFMRAGGCLPEHQISDQVKLLGAEEFQKDYLTIYPRGLHRVVNGFKKAGLLEKQSHGTLKITDHGKNIKRQAYDKIVQKKSHLAADI